MTVADVPGSGSPLGAAVDAAELVVWSASPDGGLTVLNAFGRRYVGYGDADGSGLDWRDAVHPDDRDALGAALAADAPRFECEVRLRERASGAYRWFLCRARAQCDADGVARGWIGTAIDVHDHRVAQRALAHRERQLRVALQAAGMGTWRVGPDLPGIECDAVHRALWELPDAPAMPSTAALFERLHPDDREPMRALDREVRTTGRASGEFRVRTAQGAMRWLAVFASADRDRAGGTGEIVGFTHDVTARRDDQELLRLTTARLQTALQSSPIVLFSQDLSLRYTWLHNPGLGLDPARMIGRRDEEVTERPEDGRRLHALKSAVIASGRGARHEVTVWRDGRDRYYDLTVEPTRDADGSVTGVTCVAFDITERREAELALHEADRRKDAFLATLAHELRNPLGPVRNGLAAMHRSTDPAVHARARDLMERQVVHMVRLVDDLLDLSRISTGKLALRRRPLDLVGVLRAAADAARHAFVEACTRLELELPPGPLTVDGDEDRIAQVVGNLLHNAAKFTQPGGRVTLSAEALGGGIELRVRDDGIGLAPEHLEEVFEMFTQYPMQASRASDGLGIGLHLSRRLVELHGGTIVARSDGPGRGAEFVVCLPAASAPEAAAEVPQAAAAGGAALDVLIVDDNADATQSLELLIGIWGHRVHCALDGFEGLALAERVRPDVIVLDLGMPRMDGCEVARRIRAMPWGRTPLLVALTGWGQEADRQRTRDSGFDAHLVKPAEPALLERMLADRRAAMRAS
jgi:PAS domain S-box-containing protein